MGLFKCKPGNTYTFYFFTGGPWNSAIPQEELRTQLQDAMIAQYGRAHIKECIIALELSTDNYHHFHIGLHLDTQTLRWKDCVNKLLKIVRQWPRDPLETRKPNVGAFFVPQGAKGGFEVLRNYLKHPVKEKTIDSDVLEFDINEKYWQDSFGQAIPGYMPEWCYYNDPTKFRKINGVYTFIAPPFDEKIHLSKQERELRAYYKLTYEQQVQAHKDHDAHMWKLRGECSKPFNR